MLSRARPARSIPATASGTRHTGARRQKHPRPRLERIRPTEQVLAEVAPATPLIYTRYEHNGGTKTSGVGQPLAGIIILISSKSYIAPRKRKRQTPGVRLLCVREVQVLNKICLGQEQ